jgi:ribosomal protein S18 acetylase RimI-like enzyme
MISEMKRRDLDQVAVIHRELFPGDRRTQYGRGYLRAFYAFFMERAERAALVATDRKTGRVVGFLLGAPGGFDCELEKRVFPAAVLGVVMRPTYWIDRRVWRRAIEFLVGSRAISRKSENRGVDAGTGYLYLVGVSPAARGLGVGKGLVSQFEDRCRELGFQKVVLSVHARNRMAREFYEGCGWRATAGRVGPDALYEKYLDV